MVSSSGGGSGDSNGRGGSSLSESLSLPVDISTCSAVCSRCLSYVGDAALNGDAVINGHAVRNGDSAAQSSSNASVSSTLAATLTLASPPAPENESEAATGRTGSAISSSASVVRFSRDSEFCVGAGKRLYFSCISYIFFALSCVTYQVSVFLLIF